MKLEIYRRTDGLYAWRLKALNNRIIATDGGQGYASKATCWRMGVWVTGAWRDESTIEVVDLC